MTKNYLCISDATGFSTMQAQQALWLSQGHAVQWLDLAQAPDLDLWPHLESPSAAQVRCMGNAALIESVRDMTGHWPSAQIHLEVVSADHGATAPSAATADGAFEVVIHSTGERITVEAELTLLEALQFAGVGLPNSCQSGSCGTCRTGLISGAADHRDFVLLDSEHASFIMPCVSRASAGETLVLDL